MDLKSAGLKMHDGEKVRRPHWKPGVFINVPTGSNVICDVGGECADFTVSELGATDWEVVQDEIEVGDTVGRGGQGGLVVVAVDMNPAAEACIRYMDGRLDVHEISSLTLIRKGDKGLVWEGVKIAQNSYDTIVFPVMKNPDEYKGLANNDKTYRMTLEAIDG